MNMRQFKMILALAGLGFASSAAQAAPMTFGCDVPPDRFSAIEQPISTQSFSFKTVLEPVEFRKGKYAPLAQVYITSADGKKHFGIKLIASGPKDKFAILNIDVVRNGEDADGMPLGVVNLSEKLPIEFTVTNGAVTFKVGDQTGTPQVNFGNSAELNIICSTGEFVFHDMDWTR